MLHEILPNGEYTIDRPNLSNLDEPEYTTLCAGPLRRYGIPRCACCRGHNFQQRDDVCSDCRRTRTTAQIEEGRKLAAEILRKNLEAWLP